MKLQPSVLSVLFGLLLSTVIARPAAAADVKPPQAPPPATSAPQQQAQEASAPLRVMVGKSVLINTADRLKRVSVTDPAIADAIAVTPNQVLIHGRSPGEVTLVLWDDAERSRSFDLRVDVDVTSASEEIRRLFPDQKIDVSANRNTVVLSGQVASKEVSDRVQAVASAYSKNVVNVISFGATGAQEVLLEVKFAEVDRTALVQLGANILSTGAGRTIGQTTTGQFGSTGPLTLSDTFPRRPGSQFSSEFEISDLLNVFVFNPDIHLGAFIRLLQQKNVLQILAEPNLIALNGKEASFLAGGEFPIPIVQGSAGGNAVTIVFKEFGIKLKFRPNIMPTGEISLKVAPEVSSLDFANGVQLSGFTVPGLTTRRAETELQVRDGQSFVIAGLLDNRLRDNLSRVPGLGNIPILGYLFRSRDYQKQRTELMVMVTARKVAPLDQRPSMPGFPKEFLEIQKFDNGKKPAGDNGTKPTGGK
ncbi:MAG TPA: type II and III secretion system protein family protein [Clostridia bacterium]|nr:type II and III secretion system protein family protein [Clostridia bacterium]